MGNNKMNCSCVGCNRPAFSGHNFCGRTCGQGKCGHSRPQTGSPSSPQTPTCICNGCNRPPFQGFPHCGRTCATGGCGHSNSTPQGGASCVCNGCSRAPYPGYAHCGKTCASGKCGHGNGSSKGGSAQVQNIPRSDPKFIDIEQQFSTKWTHNQQSKPQPKIKQILRVVPNSSITSRFQSYQQSKKHIPPFRSGGVGNTQRRFHGTSLTCNLGSSLTPCTSGGCIVCRIVCEGFLLSKQGSNTGWGRFGKGLYFSSASSKAFDYSKTNNAIFVAEVVVGRGKKLYVDDPSLTSAPSGFDSVLGETGQALNHDEVIVYTDDAAMARYIILY